VTKQSLVCTGADDGLIAGVFAAGRQAAYVDDVAKGVVYLARAFGGVYDRIAAGVVELARRIVVAGRVCVSGVGAELAAVGISPDITARSAKIRIFDQIHTELLEAWRRGSRPATAITHGGDTVVTIGWCIADDLHGVAIAGVVYYGKLRGGISCRGRTEERVERSVIIENGKRQKRVFRSRGTAYELEVAGAGGADARIVD
jgi:hypothetical protein